MNVRFITFEDCPACRSPMRVRELVAEDGSVHRDEACSCCDHYAVGQLADDEREEEACLA